MSKHLPLAMALALLAPLGHAQSAPAPQVTRATLTNGLKVVIVEDKLAPVVTTQVNYLAGGNEVPAGFPGTAHAVEHMMFRGSPGLNKDQISALAANMGGHFNAETREDSTRYYFTVPKGDLDVALRIHAIRMAGVDMKASEWKNERGAIEQEVSRDLSSPVFKALTGIRQSLFAGTPYQHTPLGTRDSFDKTTAADLKHFHDTWYVPNNAVLVIAGDVDPTQTLAEVKKRFGPIPSHALPAKPGFAFAPVKARHIALDTDTPYGYQIRAFRLPGLQDKDYATALVLSDALGSQRAALYGMGMDGTALAGGFSADFLPHGGIGYAIGIFPKGGNSQNIDAHMGDILAKAASKGIDPALVSAAKQSAIASLEFAKNSVDGLANSWSDALVQQGLQSPQDIARAIAAVTPAEVNALAKRTFKADQTVTATLTPQSSGKPVASKGFGGAESFNSAPDSAVTLPKWAQERFATLHIPKSNLHPVDFTLANGLRVIVQPETVSDTVVVSGAIRTNEDLQAKSGQEGVADVLDSLFNFGTQRLGRLQYQQALDAISARASAGSRFGLALPAAHFAEGMKLLAENELSPALPEQAFAIVQRQEAGSVAGALQSPDFLSSQQLGEALYPKHDPSLRHATPKSVMGLHYSDVKDYYASTFRPDMTTLVIVGNVTPEQAKAVVSKYFGAWQAKGAKPKVDYPAVPLNKASQFTTPDSAAVQDSVQLVQNVAVTEDNPARFALNLGNEVLGGGFYASRFVKDLREKNGLVYTVASGFDLDKNRGSYNVQYGSDPDKALEARTLVIKDLKAMQRAPVSEGELKQAKGILLRQIPLGEASFGSIAGQLLSLSMQGKPLDSTEAAAKAYYQLSAKDVQAAYAKYIRPDDFVTAIKGPAPKA
ncbi:MAG: pitrilysin family protein [Pseudomonadota bacterium]|uniref:M16 family metallopeptidase n=1 Tax=Gallaecimonas pentaromativorans TaxID=584787 RepID=UPI00067F057F|nr:pitrilysin family protein [Gallaecimonas pentaromativorans]MED5524613.1 pitrilysin family protein [Pseudomonadota bacterium]